ncbi:molybdenum cofactor biosysynthesis protein [Lentzea guizhouensis]|uniref:Molybdenum cofactor biosysynthesis protein n=1 Tax=Lentzea guizhouensis TaxID=1586287 RepID=A0A1B2HUF2_9PSEU|nr:MOSC domain-containing protein [Lentzea guizhouensis]ANZ41318.1 molybdenum cofactor biosysynthesis protein [Lentzea guizhouensis]
MAARREVEIVALHASAVHAYEGRPSDGPRPDPGPVRRDHVEVRAKLGIVGDRYFNRPAHRNAAVTFLAAESLDPWPVDPVVARRNVVVRGFDVDALPRGAVFSLDSGDGPVRFEVHRPANPCAWMNAVIAPGAFKALRGKGGKRCVPLDDGVLRAGTAVLDIVSA